MENPENCGRHARDPCDFYHMVNVTKDTLHTLHILRQLPLGLGNVGGIWYNIHYNNNERGDTMSANVYTIEDLLVGTTYSSRTLQGEIVSAEIHPKGIWYEGCETYLVEIIPNSGYNNWGRRTYRTLAVKNS